MPYDGNGNYVRVHNWSADAANSLDINATEMDAEDNGFAAALSNAVTRDGQGKMGVDFLPNANNTLNLGSSTLRWASFNGVTIPTGSTPWTVYPTNAAEILAGVTIASNSFPYQTAIRYATNISPGVTPMDVGIQAAIDSASSGSTAVQIADTNGLSKSLLIRSTTQQNLSIIGNGRVSANLTPLTTSVANGTINVNALIVNQNGNNSTHLAHLRCTDAIGFAGYAFYAVPGGGGDASVQACFSLVVDDCWFAPSSANNLGAFYGFFSNLQMVNTVFEATKTGCIVMAAGSNPNGSSSDINCTNITMNGCFDSFLFGSVDTKVKAVITTSNLNAYGHFRGPLFEITGGQTLKFTNITCEAVSPGNLGTIGLFKFTDCGTVQCSNSSCKSRAGTSQGAIAVQIINGCTGKFSNIESDCLIGVQFSGAGVLDLEFHDCDFSNCNIPVQILSGTQSGQVRWYNCKFNNAQLECFIHSAGTPTFNMDFYECEFINAGLNGTGTNYNIDIALSGIINFIRCKIGQNVGASSASTHFINANGSGTVNVIDPIPVLNAPTGGGLFYTGSQRVNFDGIDSSMPGMPPFTPTLGGTATYSNQQGQYSVKNKTVHFRGRITVTLIGTGSANTISALPFTSNASIYGGGFAHFLAGSNVSVTAPPTMSVSPAGTTATMRGFTGAAAGTTNISPFTTGTDMIFEGAYPL